MCLLRKKRVEIVDNHTINFYTKGKLKYTNTIDNLLYIRCAGQGKITSSIVFVFSDKRIRLCMPLVMFSQYFKLYELEKLSGYLRTQFKLKQGSIAPYLVFLNTCLPIGIRRKTRIIRYILKARVGVFADKSNANETIKESNNNFKTFAYGTYKEQYTMVKYRKK